MVSQSVSQAVEQPIRLTVTPKQLIDQSVNKFVSYQVDRYINQSVRQEIRTQDVNKLVRQPASQSAVKGTHRQGRFSLSRHVLTAVSSSGTSFSHRGWGETRVTRESSDKRRSARDHEKEKNKRRSVLLSTVIYAQIFIERDIWARGSTHTASVSDSVSDTISKSSPSLHPGNYKRQSSYFCHHHQVLFFSWQHCSV